VLSPSVLALPTCHFSAISCLHVDEGCGDTLRGVEFGETAQSLAEREQPFVAPLGVSHEISQARSVARGVQADALDLPVRLELAAEPAPPLLIIDHDEAGKLVVAEQVDSKAHTLGPVGIRILALQQPPQRRAEQVGVERVDLAEVAAEQVAKLSLPNSSSSSSRTRDVNPYVIPYALGVRTLAFAGPSTSVLVSPPSWGQSAAKTAADWPPSGERSASRD
jgi:hypothetical protein